MTRAVRTRFFRGKKNFLFPCGFLWDCLSASQVEVKNWRATRKTVLTHICNPSMRCNLLIAMRPPLLTHERNWSKNPNILSFCFSVIETSLFRRSIRKPRCRVDDRGSSLLLSFSSIPSQWAQNSATNICSEFFVEESARNQISSR